MLYHDGGGSDVIAFKIKTRIGGLFAALAAFAALAFGTGCSGSKDNDHADPAPIATNPITLDVTWAVKDDATPTQMLAFADRIRASSAALWQATHGQMYIRTVTLKDKSEDADVVLDNLAQRSAEGMFAYTILYTDGTWEIHLGGNYPMQAWIHETGHAEVLEDWTLPEEYDLGDATCCAMGAYIIGSGDGLVLYCDDANCVTSRDGCWQKVILLTHPEWKYPASFGLVPATNITVQNN
jgi:hypothetical protein